jgi:hypothetical protein
MKLDGYNVYALGGLEAGKYINTAQVYEIGASLASGQALIALAHPDHLPRVYRTIVVRPVSDLSDIHLAISPLPVDWSSPNSTAGSDYNMFAEASLGSPANKSNVSVYDELTRAPAWGMYLSSSQQWTTREVTFSISEFWVYPLQAMPGKNLIGNLPNDPVKLPPCSNTTTLSVLNEQNAASKYALIYAASYSKSFGTSSAAARIGVACSGALLLIIVASLAFFARRALLRPAASSEEDSELVEMQQQLDLASDMYIA